MWLGSPAHADAQLTFLESRLAWLKYRPAILTSMTEPRLSQSGWMKQTIEESIITSLQKRISQENLLDEQWLQFKDKMQDGDELWYFRTPQKTWTEFFPRCGMEGYALVRGDRIVAEIFTSMS